MKKILAFALTCTVFISLFSGCTGVPHGVAQSGAVRTDIVIGVSSDIVSPDPHNQNDASSSRAVHMIYDTLVALSPDGDSFEPRLATSWKQLSDTEYIFTLRRGVKFHNGEMFNARDAKFSIERCMESAKTSQMTDCIKTVEILDEHSISVVTKYPFVPFLWCMASPALSMLDEGTAFAAGASFGKNPIGTGPMMFVSWIANDNFKVARNDAYWAFLPVATSITIRVIPEPTSKTMALEMGEIDIVDFVPPIDIGRVRHNPMLKTDTQLDGSVTYVGMNYLSPPLDNLCVRKAIAHAIRRDNIITVALEGAGELIDTIFPPMMPGYDSSLHMYPFDLDMARLLLARAGFSDGLTLEIVVSGDERNRIAQLMQSDLAKLGIQLDIVLLEWGAFLKHVSGKTHQMFVLSWSNAYNTDGNLYDVFHRDRPSVTNRSNYKNDAVSLKIDASRQELDPVKRGVLYRELQAEIMSDPVWVPLFVKTSVIAMDKNMGGVELLPITEHTYINAYIRE